MLRRIILIFFLMGVIYSFIHSANIFENIIEQKPAFENISDIFNESFLINNVNGTQEKNLNLTTEIEGISETDCYEDEKYSPEEKICYVRIDSNEMEEIRAQGDAILDGLEFEFGDYLNTETVWSNIIISIKPDMNIGTELVSYDIENYELGNPHKTFFESEYLKSLRNDMIRHKNIWKHVNYIIPIEYKKMVKQLKFFTDGKYQYLAFVHPYSYDVTKWVIGIDIIDTDNSHRLTSNIIHEFAHLLTLNDTQVTPSLTAIYPENTKQIQREKNKCDSFFTLDGCSKEASYINAYYKLFWKEVYDDWDDFQSEGNIEAFYQHYSDRFVSVYAATNVEEDIAETFVNFVFTRKADLSDGWIADQKILFFYNYPELVKIRTEILARVHSAYRHDVTIDQ